MRYRAAVRFTLLALAFPSLLLACSGTIDTPGTGNINNNNQNNNSNGNTNNNNNTVTSAVAFSAATSTFTEGTAGTLDVVVALTSSDVLPAGVTVTVVDGGTGSATSGTDYTALPPTTVTFPAGSANGATATVSLTVADDTSLEANETIDLALQDPTGGATLGSTTAHTATLVDNDTPSVSFATATSATTDESSASTTVIVTLTTPSDLIAPLTVEVIDAGSGTATSDSDYTAFTTSTLTFPAGSSDGATLTVDVDVLADTDIEPAETVALALQNVSGGNLGATTAHTLTITDDDFAVAFVSAASSTSDEAADPHSIELVLTSGGPLPVAVSVDVVDLTSGSATSGVDFVAFTTTTVTFDVDSPNGSTQTVSVTPVADTAVEAAETVVLGLQAPSGVVIDAPSTHTLTIVDDDFEVSFETSTSVTTDESATSINVAVTLTTGADLVNPITVEVVDTETGTATSGADYNAFSPATVTFATGSGNGSTQVVALTPIEDSDVEAGGETVVLTLQNASGAAIVAPSTHTTTITDDDVPPVARAIYVADQDTSGVFEMYLVNIEGGTPTAPTKLNGTLVAGGDVSSTTGNYDISPDGNWVFYLADQNEDNVTELFLVDVSGAGPYSATRVSANLTGTDQDVSRAYFSPDSSRLVYLADQDTNDVTELYVVSLASPGVGTRISRALTGAEGVPLNGIRFSASGAKLAYLVQDGTTSDFIEARVYDFSSDTDSTVNDPLVSGGSINSNGAFFNAAEDKMIWWGEGEQAGVDELFIVDISGPAFVQTRVHASLAGAAHRIFFALFSPNGAAVAYAGDVAVDGMTEIYAADVTGATPGTPRLVTPASAIAAMNAQSGSMVFSSDSVHLAFRADAEVDNKFEMYLADVSDLSGAVTPFKAHTAMDDSRGTSGDPDFSPDGAQLLYSADHGVNDDAFELYLTAVAAAPVDPAVSLITQSMSTTADVQINSLVPLFSADGSLIFYRADVDTDGEFDMYVVDQAGGAPSAPQKVNATLRAGTSTNSQFAFSVLGNQLLYVAEEGSTVGARLVLATLVDPTDSATFTRATLSTGGTVQAVAVRDLSP